MLLFASITIVLLLIYSVYLILSKGKIMDQNLKLIKENATVEKLKKIIESREKEISKNQTRENSRFVEIQTLNGRLEIQKNKTREKQMELNDCRDISRNRLKDLTRCQEKNKEFENSIQNLNRELNEWNEVEAKLKAIDHTRHPQRLAKTIIDEFGIKK